VTVDRVVTGGLVVFGAVAGMLLALVGAFQIPAGYAWFSVGDAIALAGTGPFCHFLGRATRSVVVGTVPALTWLTTSMLLAGKRPEGDLIITGQPKGIAFLLLGTVSAAVGIGTIRSRASGDVSPNGSSDDVFGR
jgi:hypothetical protein